MAKRVAIALAVLLLMTNGFWLYQAADRAATEKYEQQEAYEANHRIASLERLCSKLVGGMPKAEAKKLLTEISPHVEPFEKEGRINSAWLSYQIDDKGNIAETGACQ